MTEPGAGCPASRGADASSSSRAAAAWRCRLSGALSSGAAQCAPGRCVSSAMQVCSASAAAGGAGTSADQKAQGSTRVAAAGGSDWVGVGGQARPPSQGIQANQTKHRVCVCVCV